jgi:hypothetical protein
MATLMYTLLKAMGDKAYVKEDQGDALKALLGSNELLPTAAPMLRKVER